MFSTLTLPRDLNAFAFVILFACPAWGLVSSIEIVSVGFASSLTTKGETIGPDRREEATEGDRL